nr:hypothetical protein [Cryobacterium sp. HLT2-28]
MLFVGNPPEGSGVAEGLLLLDGDVPQPVLDALFSPSPEVSKLDHFFGIVLARALWLARLGRLVSIAGLIADGTVSSSQIASAEAIKEFRDSGALDGMFAKIDAGDIQLTGEGGFAPGLIKAALELGAQVTQACAS